jgi:hypothetical protein
MPMKARQSKSIHKLTDRRMGWSEMDHFKNKEDN